MGSQSEGIVKVVTPIGIKFAEVAAIAAAIIYKDYKFMTILLTFHTGPLAVSPREEIIIVRLVVVKQGILVTDAEFLASFSCMQEVSSFRFTVACRHGRMGSFLLTLQHLCVCTVHKSCNIISEEREQKLVNVHKAKRMLH